MLHCLFVVYIHLVGRIQANSQEVDLIKKLNQFYLFDHNLILIESTTNLDKFINVPESLCCVPQTLYVFEDISEEMNTKSISRSTNTFMIIGLKGINLERNLIFLTKIKDFQRDNNNLKIGLFIIESLPTSDYLLQLFKWFWQNSIVNIFVAYSAQTGIEIHHSEYSLHIYTFNPYGTFDLINLTDSESLSDYFPKYCYNLRQHSIRIAVHNDLNTFIYSKDNPKFGGNDGKLWQTIFSVTNASYTMVKFVEITDGHDIQDMVMNGTIDLGPQSHPLFAWNSPIYLYPIYMDTVAIIVPSAEPYAEFAAYLETFFDYTLFYALLLTMFLVITSLTLIRYMKYQRILFFQSVADVINLFMNDNMAIDYRNLYRAESFIILPSTLAGFVIINIILSILTSFLTRPMDQPELNTFADIERSPFPVMVPTQKNVDQLVEDFKHIWNIDWSHKIASSSFDEFLRQILSFNTSICFVYFGSKVKNLLEHQKRLNIRGFRIPTQTISQTIFCYVVPVDYPLKHCFNEIIQWIMNAGLYWKWTDESYFEFVEKGYFSKTVNGAERSGEKYYVPMFIVYGWIGSGFVFIIEIVWNRIKEKNVYLKKCNFIKKLKGK